MWKLTSTRVAAAAWLVLAGAASAQAPPAIATVAGNGGSGFTGDNGPATSASLKSPVGIAVDGAGNLYIADSSNNRVRRVDAQTGFITTVAGNGTSNYSGDGGPATSAALSVGGVAADSAGNLFIAGLYSNRIRRVDSQTHLITTVAGSGASGYTGDGFDAAGASLDDPQGVAVDSAGNLFIADTNNNCIRRVDARTRIITTVAGNGSEGYAGDGGAATAGNLNNPTGVAVDASGNIFIADQSNSRVRRVDARTGVITTVAGNGDDGFSSQNGVLATSTGVHATGVAVDGAGNLFIADSWNNRVRRVDPQSGLILLVAGDGNGRYGGDGGAATGASLDGPKGVAADSAGNLLIADTDNNRIRRVAFFTGPRLVLSPATLSFATGGFQTVSVTSSGAALTFTATASTTSGGNWLSASPASGVTPFTVTVWVNVPATAPAIYGGSITFTTGAGGVTVMPVALRSGVFSGPPGIQTVAGNGGSGFTGDNGPATSASLKSPGGIAVDGAGNLYIADSSNNRVRRVDAQTGVIATVAGNGTSNYGGDGGPATSASLSVGGVAADSAGNLFIAGLYSNRIRRVDAQTHLITTVAGSGASGYTGDGFDAAGASMSDPQGVAVDSAGNLFIADTNNNCIRRVDARTHIITTVAGNGSSGYAGDGGAATLGNLDSPTGVAVDASGNLFIADWDNFRVRRVDARTGVITTVAGNGDDGFLSQDGVPATSAGVNAVGVAVDGAGNLYMADSWNNVVRRVDPQTGAILLVAGSGNSVFSGDGGPATDAGLNAPKGVAVDGAGNLLIADTGNNRIRRVVFTRYLLTATVSPSGAGSLSAGPPSADGFYNIGTAVQLTAAANAGFQFSNWGGDLSGAINPHSLTMNAPHTVTANFVAIPTLPAVVDVQPATGSAAAQTFTFQFSHPSGYQHLSVVNVLINNVLDGRQACYLAYSVPDNVLYVVPDSGSGLLAGLLLNGSGTTGNSQCTVSGAGSFASGSGDILTLTVNLSFSSGFAGNKVVYMAARDSVNNSGWQTVGVYGVAPLPSTFPNPAGMSPPSGATLSSAIAFTYQDQSNAANLQTAWALINTAIDGRAACYVAYYRPGNQLYLYPDNGDGNQATNIVLTGNNTISNSQCTISAQGSNVQINGNTLTVSLPITFKTAFAGFKGVWLATQTLGGAQTSPWQAMGAWTVPGN